MQPGRIKLDDPVFKGTLRYDHRSVAYEKRALHPQTVQDMTFVRTTGRSYVAPKSHLKPTSEKGARINSTAARAANSPTKHSSKKAHSFAAPKRLLYAMAGILFLLGVGVAYNGWRANSKVVAQVSQMQKQSAPSENNEAATAPSTEKPTEQAVRSYAVAPNLPRYIDIAKLGVHARVMPMSVNRKNELQAPDNVHNVGWYNASSLPGQNGAMLLDGHSGIGNYKGVFNGLQKLAAGDVIDITRGDGTKFSYQVVSVNTVAAKSVDMAGMIVSADTAKPGLNLITCAGDQMPGTYQLNQRTLVRAVLK